MNAAHENLMIHDVSCFCAHDTRMINVFCSYFFKFKNEDRCSLEKKSFPSIYCHTGTPSPLSSELFVELVIIISPTAVSHWAWRLLIRLPHNALPKTR